MGSSVWAGPPDSLFLSLQSGFIGDLSGLPCRQGLDFLLEFLNEILHGVYGGILGCHVFGLLVQLTYQVIVGVIEVIHFRPVLCSCLREVSEGFLNAHQVDGSVAAGGVTSVQYLLDSTLVPNLVRRSSFSIYYSTFSEKVVRQSVLINLL